MPWYSDKALNAVAALELRILAAVFEDRAQMTVGQPAGASAEAIAAAVARYATLRDCARLAREQASQLNPGGGS